MTTSFNKAKEERDERVRQALALRCPFCQADPGEPCRTRTTGQEQPHPHSRRIGLLNSAMDSHPKIQALCCECGHLRDVWKHYHRANDENRGGGLFTHPEGWFDTITLKCSPCGKSTRHAKVSNRPGDAVRDLAEEYQRFVLTGEWEGRWKPADREVMQRKYFSQFPRNPNLHHRYWPSAAKEAREAGHTRMKGVCGADMPVPSESCDKAPSETPEGELHKPGRIDWDTEFEDTETGMWWVDMECVDCCRASNRLYWDAERERLKWFLTYFALKTPSIPDLDVEVLVEHLEKLYDQGKEGAP